MSIFKRRSYCSFLVLTTTFASIYQARSDWDPPEFIGHPKSKIRISNLNEYENREFIALTPDGTEIYCNSFDSKSVSIPYRPGTRLFESIKKSPQTNFIPAEGKSTSKAEACYNPEAKFLDTNGKITKFNSENFFDSIRGTSQKINYREIEESKNSGVLTSSLVPGSYEWGSIFFPLKETEEILELVEIKDHRLQFRSRSIKFIYLDDSYEEYPSDELRKKLNSKDIKFGRTSYIPGFRIENATGVDTKVFQASYDAALQGVPAVYLKHVGKEYYSVLPLELEKDYCHTNKPTAFNIILEESKKNVIGEFNKIFIGGGILGPPVDEIHLYNFKHEHINSYAILDKKIKFSKSSDAGKVILYRLKQNPSGKTELTSEGLVTRKGPCKLLEPTSTLPRKKTIKGDKIWLKFENFLGQSKVDKVIQVAWFGGLPFFSLLGTIWMRSRQRKRTRASH